MTAGKNTRAGFDIDLREYVAYEADLVRVLIDRGTNTIEHKRDFGTIRTGNLFVEYHQPSGPSGIARKGGQLAEMWAFEYDDNCWILVPTERLKELCRIAWKQGRTASGGDHNRYKGVLLPVRWLVPPYVEAVK
jgi:hypothetical protein